MGGDKQEIKDFISETETKLKECNNNVIELEAWKSKLRLTKEETIRQSSILNIEIILMNDVNLKNTIGYNEFSGNIHLVRHSPWLNRDAGQWEDSYESALQSYIEKHYYVVFDSAKLRSAIVNVARHNMFNPVKDRIEREKWDGDERLESFFIDLLGAEDNVYTREVTKRWIVGTISRVYRPGIKFEIVPVLSGKQGIGKSTAPSLLYTEDYFSDSLEGLGENKDDYLQLRSNVILELGELSSLKKTDINKAKNFISAKHDDIRMPYERNTVKWARRCVFIGTTNDNEYLKDLSGNRRFFPIPCANKPKLNVFEMEDSYFLQVLAEAKILYDDKQRIHFDNRSELDKEVLKLAEEYQEDAKVDDPAEEAIAKFLEMEVPADWDNAVAWVKRSYYRGYPNSKGDKELLSKFENRSRLLLLDSILTADILEIVFERDSRETLQGKANSDKKRISLIMSDMPDWESKRFYKRNNGRGYFNKTNYNINKKR